MASGGSGDTHRLCTQVKHLPSRDPASRPHPKYQLRPALPPAAVQPGRARRSGRLGRRQGFPRGRAAWGARPADGDSSGDTGPRPAPCPTPSARPRQVPPSAGLRGQRPGRPPAHRAPVAVAQAEGHLALLRGARTLPGGADIRPETWEASRKDEKPGEPVLSRRNE